MLDFGGLGSENIDFKRSRDWKGHSRDAKVAVLKSTSPIVLEDVVLGQYKGYADDPTIKNKDTNTPTFATLRLRINTPRWHGVPIIMKAGKALNERKAEMRIQFKDAPAAEYLFNGEDCPRNELGMWPFGKKMSFYWNWLLTLCFLLFE